MSPMTSKLRVLVEQPIHGKRWVAVAADWPGLERGGKTEDEAKARDDDGGHRPSHRLRARLTLLPPNAKAFTRAARMGRGFACRGVQSKAQAGSLCLAAQTKTCLAAW